MSDRLPEFPSPPGRVVVVAAHPEDVVLGIGGLLISLRRGGQPLDLIMLADVSSRRRAELTEALRRLGLAAVRPLWLETAPSRRSMATALKPALEGASLCIGPWVNDPRPDRATAGRAARDAAGAAVTIWCYTRPTDPTPGRRWTSAAHRLASDDLVAKRAAIEAFGSLLAPGPDGEAPPIDATTRLIYEQPEEVLVCLPDRTSTPLSDFGVADSASGDSEPERRRRAVLTASLPRTRYGRVLHGGSGNGLLTRDLALRSRELIAVDGSVAAVVATERAVTGLDHVSVRLGRIPGDLPNGPFDLIVLADLAHHFDRPDLDAVVDRIEQIAGARGDLLILDGRAVEPNSPRDGDDAHDQVLGRPGWEVLVEHLEPDFLVHTLRRH